MGNRESAFDLSSRRTTEHPESAPASGLANPTIFKGGSGPGYWLQSQARVVFEDLALPPCEIIRLSPEALWFVPSGTTPSSIKALRVTLKWEGRTIGPLRGRIVHLGQRTERPCVGFRFVDVSMDHGREILALVNELVSLGQAEAAFQLSPIQEQITSVERIGAILGALTGVASEVVTLASGKAVRFQIESADVEKASVTWSMMGEAGPEEVEGPMAIDIAGYNSVYRLHVPGLAQVDGQVVTAFPTKLERMRYRFFRRGVVRSEHRVEFRHPVWRDTYIEAEVRDISFGGISFTTKRDDDLLFPGLVIPYLEVKTMDGKTIGLRAQVRSVATIESEGIDVCGMSVTAYWPEGEGDWMRLASETLYPTTRTSEDLTDELWQLFDDSGYFKLAGKTPEEFVELKKGFRDLGKRAGAAPRLICQAVWPSPRGVEASVSFLKAYQTSWMGHQLAKRPGRPPVGVPGPGQIMRDIYMRAFEHPQADPDFDWMIGYIEPHVPWMNKAHIEFARKYVSTGHSLIMPLNMLSGVCNEMSGEGSRGLEMGPSTPDELEQLSDLVRATRPASYFESLDFNPERIGFEEVDQQWGNGGFERRRAIYTARRGGKAVAAMVMETGELGSNMFQLLDSVRVFPLIEEGRDAYVPLLDEARRWYAARNRPSFLYFREDEDMSYNDAARLHHVSEACFWIISASILPDFLEHVSELTGRRRFGG
jgi:hypothetical protein